MWSPGPADFGVAKRIRDNDPSIHENQQVLYVQEVLTHFIKLLLYKMGHYFLDRQYNRLKDN